MEETRVETATEVVVEEKKEEVQADLSVAVSESVAMGDNLA